MLLVKKSIGLLVPFTMISVYLFILYTDRNLKPLGVGLSTLENSRNGLYKVSVKISDIEQNEFTVNDGNISLRIMGNLQNKKLSDLYTQGKELYGHVTLKKNSDTYTLVSLKRIEDELYITDTASIKDKIIVNTKGILGKFQ